MKLGLMGNLRELPTPDSFNVNIVEIGVSKRCADGALVKGVTGYKRIISISYDSLEPDDMKYLNNLYTSLSNASILFSFIECGVEVEIPVLINSLLSSYYVHDTSYPTGISIVLEEV